MTSRARIDPIGIGSPSRRLLRCRARHIGNSFEAMCIVTLSCTVCGREVRAMAVVAVDTSDCMHIAGSSRHS